MQSPNYLIVSITNQNDVWEADVFGSDDGFTASTESFHLILGDLPTLADKDLRQIAVGPALTAVGWAIEDQMEDDELGIRIQAYGAKSLIQAANDNTQFVVKLDVGNLKRDEAIARLTVGADKHQFAERQQARNRIDLYEDDSVDVRILDTAEVLELTG